MPPPTLTERKKFEEEKAKAKLENKTPTQYQPDPRNKGGTFGKLNYQKITDDPNWRKEDSSKDYLKNRQLPTEKPWSQMSSSEREALQQRVRESMESGVIATSQTSLGASRAQSTLYGGLTLDEAIAFKTKSNAEKFQKAKDIKEQILNRTPHQVSSNVPTSYGPGSGSGTYDKEKLAEQIKKREAVKKNTTTQTNATNNVPEITIVGKIGSPSIITTADSNAKFTGPTATINAIPLITGILGNNQAQTPAEPFPNLLPSAAGVNVVGKTANPTNINIEKNFEQMPWLDPLKKLTPAEKEENKKIVKQLNTVEQPNTDNQVRQVFGDYLTGINTSLQYYNPFRGNVSVTNKPFGELVDDVSVNPAINTVINQITGNYQPVASAVSLIESYERLGTETERRARENPARFVGEAVTETAIAFASYGTAKGLQKVAFPFINTAIRFANDPLAKFGEDQFVKAFNIKKTTKAYQKGIPNTASTLPTTADAPFFPNEAIKGVIKLKQSPWESINNIFAKANQVAKNIANVNEIQVEMQAAKLMAKLQGKKVPVGSVKPTTIVSVKPTTPKPTDLMKSSQDPFSILGELSYPKQTGMNLKHKRIVNNRIEKVTPMGQAAALPFHGSLPKGGKNESKSTTPSSPYAHPNAQHYIDLLSNNPKIVNADFRRTFPKGFVPQPQQLPDFDFLWPSPSTVNPVAALPLEQQGKKIIHMEVGEPDFMPDDPEGPDVEEIDDWTLREYLKQPYIPKDRQTPYRPNQIEVPIKAYEWQRPYHTSFFSIVGTPNIITGKWASHLMTIANKEKLSKTNELISKETGGKGVYRTFFLHDDDRVLGEWVDRSFVANRQEVLDEMNAGVGSAGEYTLNIKDFLSISPENLTPYDIEILSQVQLYNQYGRLKQPVPDNIIEYNPDTQTYTNPYYIVFDDLTKTGIPDYQKLMDIERRQLDALTETPLTTPQERSDLKKITDVIPTNPIDAIQKWYSGFLPGEDVPVLNAKGKPVGAVSNFVELGRRFEQVYGEGLDKDQLAHLMNMNKNISENYGNPNMMPETLYLQPNVDDVGEFYAGDFTVRTPSGHPLASTWYNPSKKVFTNEELNAVLGWYAMNPQLAKVFGHIQPPKFGLGTNPGNPWWNLSQLGDAESPRLQNRKDVSDWGLDVKVQETILNAIYDVAKNIEEGDLKNLPNVLGTSVNLSGKNIPIVGTLLDETLGSIMGYTPAEPKHIPGFLTNPEGPRYAAELKDKSPSADYYRSFMNIMISGGKTIPTRADGTSTNEKELARLGRRYPDMYTHAIDTTLPDVFSQFGRAFLWNIVSSKNDPRWLEYESNKDLITEATRVGMGLFDQLTKASNVGVMISDDVATEIYNKFPNAAPFIANVLNLAYTNPTTPWWKKNMTIKDSLQSKERNLVFDPKDPHSWIREGKVLLGGEENAVLDYRLKPTTGALYNMFGGWDNEVVGYNPALIEDLKRKDILRSAEVPTPNSSHIHPLEGYGLIMNPYLTEKVSSIISLGKGNLADVIGGFSDDFIRIFAPQRRLEINRGVIDYIDTVEKGIVKVDVSKKEMQKIRKQTEQAISDLIFQSADLFPLPSNASIDEAVEKIIVKMMPDTILGTGDEIVEFMNNVPEKVKKEIKEMVIKINQHTPIELPVGGWPTGRWSEVIFGSGFDVSSRQNTAIPAKKHTFWSRILVNAEQKAQLADYQAGVVALQQVASFNQAIIEKSKLQFLGDDITKTPEKIQAKIDKSDKKVHKKVVISEEQEKRFNINKIGEIYQTFLDTTIPNKNNPNFLHILEPRLGIPLTKLYGNKIAEMALRGESVPAGIMKLLNEGFWSHYNRRGAFVPFPVREDPLWAKMFESKDTYRETKILPQKVIDTYKRIFGVDEPVFGQEDSILRDILHPEMPRGVANYFLKKLEESGIITKQKAELVRSQNPNIINLQYPLHPLKINPKYNSLVDKGVGDDPTHIVGRFTRSDLIPAVQQMPINRGTPLEDAALYVGMLEKVLKTPEGLKSTTVNKFQKYIRQLNENEQIFKQTWQKNAIQNMNISDITSPESWSGHTAPDMFFMPNMKMPIGGLNWPVKVNMQITPSHPITDQMAQGVITWSNANLWKAIGIAVGLGGIGMYGVPDARAEESSPKKPKNPPVTIGNTFLPAVLEASSLAKKTDQVVRDSFTNYFENLNPFSKTNQDKYKSTSGEIEPIDTLDVASTVMPGGGVIGPGVKTAKTITSRVITEVVKPAIAKQQGYTYLYAIHGKDLGQNYFFNPWASMTPDVYYLNKQAREMYDKQGDAFLVRYKVKKDDVEKYRVSNFRSWKHMARKYDPDGMNKTPIGKFNEMYKWNEGYRAIEDFAGITIKPKWGGTIKTKEILPFSSNFRAADIDDASDIAIAQSRYREGEFFLPTNIIKTGEVIADTKNPKHLIKVAKKITQQQHRDDMLKAGLSTKGSLQLPRLGWSNITLDELDAATINKWFSPNVMSPKRSTKVKKTVKEMTKGFGPNRLIPLPFFDQISQESQKKNKTTKKNTTKRNQVENTPIWGSSFWSNSTPNIPEKRTKVVWKK